MNKYTYCFLCIVAGTQNSINYTCKKKDLDEADTAADKFEQTLKGRGYTIIRSSLISMEEC